MKTLRESLGKPVLFHWVGWHGKDGIQNSRPGYMSNDPNVIARQLACMRAFGGDGAGVIALSYGPTVSTFMHESSMKMAMACNATGMPFALCYDPWTVRNSADKTQAMIDVLKHPDTQEMLGLDCYLAGKPVLDFDTGVDRNKVLAAVPGIKYWLKDVDYDWVKIPPKPNHTQLPNAYVRFDDGSRPDRNKSCWDQTKPCRIVESHAGREFWGLNVSAGDWVQIVTWNDYDEGTCIEPFASVATGLKI